MSILLSLITGRVFTIIIVFMFLGVTGILALKLKKVSNISLDRLSFFSSSFHKLSHLIRDEYYLVGSLFKDNQLNQNLLLERLSHLSCEIVNAVADCFTASTGYSISACIKYFHSDTPFAHNGSIDSLNKKMIVKTLCRSANSHPDRFNYQFNDSAFENTALTEIIKNHSDCFSDTDLTSYEKRFTKRYFNANPNWQNYYSQTIVVPIRVRSGILDLNNSNGQFILVGFLCVDAATVEAFQDNEVEYYVDLLKSFADELYSIFDRFLYHYNALEERY